VNQIGKGPGLKISKVNIGMDPLNGFTNKVIGLFPSFSLIVHLVEIKLCGLVSRIV
jgi:hypothetical protein